MVENCAWLGLIHPVAVPVSLRGFLPCRAAGTLQLMSGVGFPALRAMMPLFVLKAAFSSTLIDRKKATETAWGGSSARFSPRQQGSGGAASPVGKRSAVRALCRRAGPPQGGAPSIHSWRPALFHCGPTPTPGGHSCIPSHTDPTSQAHKVHLPDAPGTGISGNMAGGSASQATALSVLEFSTSLMLLVLMQSGYSRKMTSHACQLFLLFVWLKWWLTPDPWPLGRPRWPSGWSVIAPHNKEEKLPGRPGNQAYELPYPTMPSPERVCLRSRAWPKSRVVTPAVIPNKRGLLSQGPGFLCDLSGIWAGEGQCHRVSWARGWVQTRGGQHSTGLAAQKQSANNSEHLPKSDSVSTGPGLPGGRQAGQAQPGILWTSGSPPDSHPFERL